MGKHLGITCLPGRGHLYPAAALGRRLTSRGFKVTIYSRRVASSIARSAGLCFHPIDLEELSKIKVQSRGSKDQNGPNTLDVMQNHAKAFLGHAPGAISSTKLDGLIVDQLDFATGSVADMLGIPFVTMCIQPPLYLNAESPGFMFDWIPTTGQFERTRNERRNEVVTRLLRPISSLVAAQRALWGLRPHPTVNDFLSKRASITQLPASLEFPFNAPESIYYTGPFSDGSERQPVQFPWHRLNGKPLIYASMGTVRNNSTYVFRKIMQACEGLDAQLVLSLGGTGIFPSDVGPLSDNAIVVYYVPQNDILCRASVTITHAGINTVLESLFHGVPMVAIPITDDQPGMAARLRWRHLAEVVELRDLSTPRLQNSIRKVLEDPDYRATAKRFEKDMRSRDSLGQAVEIVERQL